jgi:hypothetical protein
MKLGVRYIMWTSTLLVFVTACYFGTVHAQEQGKGDPTATPSNQVGEMPGQERMGGRGQMA